MSVSMHSSDDVPHKGKKHLIWGFVVALILMFAVSILVLIRMSAVNQEAIRLLNVQHEKAVQVSNMRDAMRKRQVSLRDMVIRSDPFLKDEAWQVYFNAAPDFILARQRLVALGLSDAEKTALARLSEKTSAAYQNQQAVVDMVRNGASAREVSPFLQSAILSQNEAATEMSNLIRMQRESAVSALKLSKQRQRETLILLLGIGALASLAAISIAIAALARDRKLVRDLDNYRLHLQDLVGERTKQLEDTIGELESFSYSLAHDLRQPLRGLDGYSLILLEEYGDKLDVAGKEYLDRIRAGSQRIGQLLDGMLKLCHLNRLHIQRTEVDLSSMCRAIVEQLRPDLEQRTVEFRIADHVVVNADADLMRIVLENLLLNSLKFTSKKDQALIEFGCSVEPSGTTCFVRDNGVGFDMRYANKLFGVFERLHGVQEFEGIGIGLATISRIIERHGGRVWAEAEPGKGATFFFTLK